MKSNKGFITTKKHIYLPRGFLTLLPLRIKIISYKIATFLFDLVDLQFNASEEFNESSLWADQSYK